MLQNLPAYLAYIKKAIINVTGLVTSLLALGLLPDPYNKYAATVLAVLTAITHFMAANAAAPGTGEAVEEIGPADEDEGEEIPEEFLPAEVITAGQVAAQHQIDAPPPIDVTK